MKRLRSVLGALVLVGAVVAVVVWLRPEASPPVSEPLKDVVVQYADGSPLWNSKVGGPEPALVTQVLAEARQHGSLDLDRLRRVGAIVVTTIDPKAQAAGIIAVEAAVAAQPATLRYALTAVDPVTGGVTAYVPGARGADETDYATGVLKQPGQAFFPINVVAGLQNGKTLDTVFDGRSPRKIAGVEVRDDAECGERCTVRDALAKSSVVALYDLVVNETGQKAVQTAARQAGVPETAVIDGIKRNLISGEGGNAPNAGVAAGADSASIRTLDLTTVYATFAAGGVRHRTHFVSRISSADGSLLYRATESAEPAFDQDVARSREISAQVTKVLRDNTRCPGTVCRTAEYSLPGALPSGPHSHAWAVGYTDRMAITVLVTGTAPTERIGDAGLPRAIWQGFAEKA